MIKDSNIREKVTLTKEQSKELAEIADAYGTSKSKVIAILVSALLSYNVGLCIGDMLRQEIFTQLNTKPKGKRASSGEGAPRVARKGGKDNAS